VNSTRTDKGRRSETRIETILWYPKVKAESIRKQYKLTLRTGDGAKGRRSLSKNSLLKRTTTRCYTSRGSPTPPSFRMISPA